MNSSWCSKYTVEPDQTHSTEDTQWLLHHTPHAPLTAFTRDEIELPELLVPPDMSLHILPGLQITLQKGMDFPLAFCQPHLGALDTIWHLKCH